MRRLSPIVLLLFGAFQLAACVGEEATTTTTDGDSSISNPPVGVVDDSAGFYVRAQQSAKYTYYTHRGSESGTTAPTYSGSFDWDQDCVAEEGDDVMCYVEAAEYDLWYHGYSMQFNVPSDMCTYFEVRLPWYYKYPAGKGPELVEYTEDSTAGTIEDQVNSRAGQAYCPFDHTSDNGPNCCYGTYTTKVNVVGGTEPPSSTPGDWGGSIASCAAGPAMDLSPKSSLGLPVADIYYVDGTGMNSVYTPKRSYMSFNNLYLANYFDIATTTDYNNLSTADYPPAFVQAANPYIAEQGTGAHDIVITDSDDGTGTEIIATGFNGNLSGDPFYSFDCYDEYRERVARIRVMVRSWDTTSQLNTSTDYTPDYGVEGGVGGSSGKHDFTVWGDLFFNYTDGTAQALPAGAIRKSWANTAAAECSNTSGPFTCREGYSSYTDGFPGEIY